MIRHFNAQIVTQNLLPGSGDLFCVLRRFFIFVSRIGSCFDFLRVAYNRTYNGVILFSFNGYVVVKN